MSECSVPGCGEEAIHFLNDCPIISPAMPGATVVGLEAFWLPNQERGRYRVAEYQQVGWTMHAYPTGFTGNTPVILDDGFPMCVGCMDFFHEYRVCLDQNDLDRIREELEADAAQSNAKLDQDDQEVDELNKMLEDG